MQNLKILLIIIIILGSYMLLCYRNKTIHSPNNKKIKKIQENMNTGKIQACFFGASWCGHCKDTKPKWEKMKKLIKNKNIEILEINCEENNNKCKIYTSGKESELEGFPTITVRKLDTNNKVINEVEYNNEPDKKIYGNREPDDLLNFINYYYKNL